MNFCIWSVRISTHRHSEAKPKCGGGARIAQNLSQIGQKTPWSALDLECLSDRDKCSGDEGDQSPSGSGAGPSAMSRHLFNISNSPLRISHVILLDTRRAVESHEDGMRRKAEPVVCPETRHAVSPRMLWNRVVVRRADYHGYVPDVELFSVASSRYGLTVCDLGAGRRQQRVRLVLIQSTTDSHNSLLKAILVYRFQQVIDGACLKCLAGKFLEGRDKDNDRRIGQ